MPIKRITCLLASILLAVTGVSACSEAGQSEGAAPGPDIESAFLFAFPIYEFARTAQTNVGEEHGAAPAFNQISQRSTLSDHTARSVTAPNNDTIYISAFLDLASGPVRLYAPSSQARYFSIAFMSVMTDNFAYIGTRATGGEGGVFWIAGPGWEGEAPDGVSVIQAPTNDVWMLMRTLVDGPEDLEAARAFQAQLTLSAPDGYEPARFGTPAADVMDPVNFLAVVNEMIQRSPGATGPITRASDFAAWGIGSDPGTLSEDLIEAWRDYLPQGVRMLRDGFRNRRDVRNGWSYQPPGVGDFGDNDRLRSAVALGGLAALGEEEAMYFHANFGPDGAVLNGAKTYRWRLPAGGVPVDAFWSVTLYEASPDGRWFLVDNPIGRYSIGNRTPGLVYEDDGSLVIYVQADPPGEDQIANWLPAPRDTDMRLALRAYLPREDVRARQWLAPPLEIVD